MSFSRDPIRPKLEYKYFFDPKENITVYEIVQLLPLLIDSWKTLNNDELVNCRKILSTSTLGIEISGFPKDGLGRHFEELVPTYVSRETIFDGSNPKYKYTFEPKEDITPYEVAQLLPLLIDAWKALNSYELISSKEIPSTSALYKKISKFPEDGLGRHFKPVSKGFNLEAGFKNEPKYKYIFNPKDELKNDLKAHDIAQVLPILIEAWTNKVHPYIVKEKKIPSDLNNKIYMLFKKIQKDCFEEIVED